MMYLSFLDPEMDVCLGTCIISGPTEDVVEAARLAWDRDCNPGGEVAGWVVTDLNPAWPFEPDHLYTPAEAVALGILDAEDFGPRTRIAWGLLGRHERLDS